MSLLANHKVSYNGTQSGQHKTSSMFSRLISSVEHLKIELEKNIVTQVTFNTLFRLVCLPTCNFDFSPLLAQLLLQSFLQPLNTASTTPRWSINTVYMLCSIKYIHLVINPFSTYVLLLCPPQTSENRRLMG